MAAGNSSLQIEVVSVGIADTVRKLDSLGNAAGRNEAKVKLLTDSLGKLMVAQSSAIASAAQHANLMSAIAQSMGLVSQAATATANQVALLNANLATLNNTSNQTTNAFHRKSNAGGLVAATLRAMATAAAAYLGLNFAKGIVEAADGWIMMQAKLKLATGSMQEAKKVQGDLFDVSQRLRVPLDDLGKLYTRMSIPMQRMGKDSAETAKQVEFVALALKLNGATAGEASSVMLQYSQSVNAGRLNGAEFNAVAEGAPGILRAIEAELRATGKWSEYGGKSLKKMGADGEITFDLMNRAAQRALPQMRKDFEELPLTVDGAIQRIKNAWFKAMGEMGEETGMGKKLAEAIGQLERDIPKIRDALAGTFTFLYDNFGRIVTILEVLVAGKLINWLAKAALALPALATGMGTAAAAVTGATGALGLLGAGLTALTGPWGIAIALVGTAAVAAWNYFASEAPKADAAVTASTKVQTVDRIRLIQKEIDIMNERNGVAAKKPILHEATANEREQDDLIARIGKLKSAQGSMISEPAKVGIQSTINLLQTQLDKTKAEQSTLDALKKLNLNAMNAGKVGVINTAFNEKYATDIEKAATAVKKYRDEVLALGGTPDADIMKKIRLDIIGKGTVDKVDHFKKLRAEVAATTAELELNIATGEKATTAEKLIEAFKSGKNKDYNALSPKNKFKVMADVENNVKLEQEIELRNRLNKAIIEAGQEEEKHNKKMAAGLATTDAEILKTRQQIAALTESKTAAKDLAAAQLEVAASSAEAMAIRQMDKNGNMQAYEDYMAQARKLRELAGAKQELGQAQDQKAATDELNKLLDPKKAMNFGTALAEAFGEVGGAIGDMSKALGVFAKEQYALDASRKNISVLPESKLRTAGLIALDKKEEQSKLRMYGAMAGGAKGFFKEHTVAYKVLGVAEKAFRAAELAETFANFAIKSGLLTAFTGLFVTAKATEVAVDTAASAVMLGAHVAAGTADVAVTATTEAAKNALKIPGVLMSFMSWLGPWGMAAGGVAIAAVLGSSGSSGAAPIDLKARQEKQGTGTILGDDSAKSESITSAMSALEDNSNIGLVLTSNMLSSLRGIEASMQGLASAVFRATGMTTGKNFGVTEGISGGGFGSSIFGGKTTTTISDTGLALNGTASDFMDGKGVQQYIDVNKQRSGGWFSKDKSWNERSYKDASDEINTTIGRVFQNINDTIGLAAASLGANGSSIKDAMDAFVIKTEVSFKDLKGNELTEALNNVFSASADGIARSVFPGLEAFQKAGEGYYQTLTRVSTGTEQAQNALDSFGVTMVGRDSLVNKTGDIAAELVRQSVMAANAGTTMSDIMKVMDGSMADLVDGYKTLLNIQDTMRGAKLGKDVSIDTIRGAGGIPELQSALESFVDGFYSDTEKQVIGLSKLQAEFGRLNVVMPESKEGFKSLVASMMAGNTESQELAGRVLLLSGGVADLFSGIESSLESLKERTKDLQVSLIRSNGDASAADAAQRLIDIKSYGAAEVAAYDYNAALSKQVELATSLKSLSEDSTNLQISLLRAQGDASAADAAQRLVSIKNYGEAEIAIFDYNTALKKHSELLVERASLESQLLQLQNDTVALRNLERRTVNESNLELFDKITAIKFAQTAVTQAFDTLKRSVAAEKTRIGLIKDVASEAVTKIKSVFELLKSNISDLYGTVDNTRVMQSEQGSEFISNALAAVLSTGYLPDAKELTAAITAARGGLNANQFATQFEADQAALVMAGQLSQLQIASGEQLSAAEQALLVANDQLKALDDSLVFYQQQIDAVNGVNTSVLSIGVAVSNLATAIATQQAAMVAALSLRAAPQAPQAPAPSAASSNSQAVLNAYASVGRTGFGADQYDVTKIDTNGYQYWVDQLSSGTVSAKDFQSTFLTAVTAYTGSNAEAYQGVMGTAQRLLDSGKDLPGFAVGTNYVPYDMVAQIHEGEAIVPKAYNPAAGNGGGNTTNNDQLEKLVEGLTTEVKRLQGLVAEGNINTGRTAVAVHGNPDRPVLVEIAT